MTSAAGFDAGGSGSSFWLLSDDNLKYNGGAVVIGSQSISTGTETDFKLSVDGKLVAKDIVVTVYGWSDFVFEDNYKLKPLSQVEEYINLNGHLPDVPSEAEVIQNGMNVEEMNKVLLQKVEELTLYIIDMKKEIDSLKAKSDR